MRTRWIIIGTVRTRYVVAQGWGSPNGVEIGWRGHVSWCQPYTFLCWDDLFWAVRRRVELAGLGLVAVASDVKLDCTGHVVLRALVRRNPSARRRQSFESSSQKSLPELPDLRPPVDRLLIQPVIAIV